MEPHPHRNHYRLIILTLFIGLSLIGIALVFYYQRIGMIQDPLAANTQTNTTNPKAQPTATKRVLTGVKFTLEPSTVSPSYPVQSNLSVNVLADSNNNKVLGFDVIVGRDSDAYDVVAVESLLPEFTVLKFVKDDKFTITGILKPSITKTVIFKNTPIAKITLKPKKSGQLALTVLESESSETSKIMSADSKDNPTKLLLDASSTLRLDIN